MSKKRETETEQVHNKSPCCIETTVDLSCINIIQNINMYSDISNVVTFLGSAFSARTRLSRAGLAGEGVFACKFNSKLC